jgi:hypothetical protein
LWIKLIISLEKELVLDKSHLSNSSSAKVGCILSSQKSFGDKCELGFDKCVSKTSIVNKAKISFVFTY